MLNEAAIDRRPDPVVLTFGLILTYVAAFQMFKLPSTLPVMIGAYGYDRPLAGAFMSVYAVAGLLLSIPIGRWIQRDHLKAAIYAGLAAMSGGSVLCLYRPESGVMMLAGRALEGVAYTVIGVAGPVIVNGEAPPQRYPLVISLLSLWIPIGQATAALTSTALMPGAGWRGVWWAGLVIALITLTWSVIVRLPAVHIRPVRQNRSGSVLQGDTRSERPLLLTVTIVFLLWTGQYYAYMTWLPQYLVEVHGLSLAASNIGYLLPVSVIIVVNVGTGFLLRAGARIGVLFAVGAILQAIGWWMIPWTDQLAWGIVSLALYGVAAGVSPTCLFGITGMIASRSGRPAAGFGLVMSGRNIGVLFGPILIGYLYTLWGAWTDASFVFAVISTVTAAGGLVLAWQLKQHGYYGNRS